MKKDFLKQYVKDAIRTESKLEKLELDKQFVSNLFLLFINTGELLDGLKKQVFYNRSEKLDKELKTRLNSIRMLCDLLESNYFKELAVEPVNNFDSRVFHGILGSMTESSELAEIVHKCLINSKEKIDKVHVQEEINDGQWYNAILHDALNLDWEQGMTNNINKLKVRYPEKFTTEHSINRDLKKERKELENKL